MYRLLRPTATPESILVNALQLPSLALVVLPVRTVMARLVPAGVSLLSFTTPQLVTAPASATRDVKVPVATYGVARSQSTDKAPSFVFTSLTCKYSGVPTARLMVAAGEALLST